MLRQLPAILLALALAPGCAASVYTRQVVSPSSTKEVYQDPPQEIRDGTFRRIQASESEAAFNLKLALEPRCQSARLGQQLVFSRDFYAKDTWPLYPITIVGVGVGAGVAAAYPNNWIAASVGGTAGLVPLLAYLFLPNDYWGAETLVGQRPIGKWEGVAHACGEGSPTSLADEPVDLVAVFRATRRSLSWSFTTDALGAFEARSRETIQRVAGFCGPATVTFRLRPLVSPTPDAPQSPHGAIYSDPSPSFEEPAVLAGRLDEIADPAARELAAECEAARLDGGPGGEPPRDAGGP